VGGRCDARAWRHPSPRSLPYGRDDRNTRWSRLGHWKPREPRGWRSGRAGVEAGRRIPSSCARGGRAAKTSAAGEASGNLVPASPVTPLDAERSLRYSARPRVPRTRTSPSSRGLGHRPFTAATRVRIPLGTPPDCPLQNVTRASKVVSPSRMMVRQDLRTIHRVCV
jgi:hypothetical protein